MMDEISFKQWLSEFFTKKSNELQYSITSQPKRMEKITIDLSVAPINPFRVAVPFKSMTVNRIFSTSSPATDKSGTISILFDQPNLGNIANAIALFPNDTLNSGTLVSECYFTWTAQADTSITIYFYPDISLVAGTTKTQIVGSVSVINTALTALQTKYPQPSSLASIQCAGNAGAATYTVAAGFYARVTGYANSGTATGFGAVTVGGGAFYIALAQAGANLTSNSQSVFAPAGTQIAVSSNQTASVAVAYIELYAI